MRHFATLPGGGALAGSFTANGTTTTWVPLIDTSGSTIGLVNAAATGSPPATTYTYDPSGTPTVGGTTNDWPFLYHGIEQEFVDAPYYYSGSGQFYSPQLVRSLSEAGQTGSSGTGGGPSARQVPYGPGSQGNGSFGHWYVGQLGPNSELGDIPDIPVPAAEGLYYWIPAGEIAQDIEELVSFFEWLFGGSSAPPTPRQLFHGRHPLYPQILGIQNGLIPTEGSPTSGQGRPLAKNDDIEPGAGPIAALTVGLETAGTAEELGGGPEDAAADVVAGAAIIAGSAVALYKAYQAYQSGHDEDCDKEWEAARATCRELLSRRNPPRGLTGGYKNIEDCARGFVTEECGGNPVELW